MYIISVVQAFLARVNLRGETVKSRCVNDEATVSDSVVMRVIMIYRTDRLSQLIVRVQRLNSGIRRVLS